MIQSFLEAAADVGIKILISLIVIFVCFKLINALEKKISKRNMPKYADKTIYRSFVYAGKILAKCLVCLCVIGYLGLDTSSIDALLASMGVGIGLAVNGALANVAGGVLLLITRPYKVDDYVEIDGNIGTIEDIHLVYTKMLMPDNRVIDIPNSVASSTTIINYSEKPFRRIELIYSISYDSDFRKAEQLVLDTAAENPRIRKDPAPSVRVLAHNESSIDLCCWVWATQPEYWDVLFEMNEDVKNRFDANGIEIPFKQVDIHMKSE